MGKHWRWVACFAIVFSFSACKAHAAIISTFDSDAEGWTFINDAHSSSGWDAFGNPAGSLHGVDRVLSTVWFFRAPAKFLGDQSSLYGTEFRYDLWASHFNPNADKGELGDVVLFNEIPGPPINGPDVRLIWQGAAPVAGAWTTQSVRLDVTGGWVNRMTGNPATEVELRLVLADLDLLAIRGEYRSGADNAFLDNVAFGVPEPSTFSCLIGLGAIFGLSRLRRCKGAAAASAG